MTNFAALRCAYTACFACGKRGHIVVEHKAVTTFAADAVYHLRFLLGA